MKCIIFSILILLPFLGYGQTQTVNSGASTNKKMIVKSKATLPRIGYADLKAIRMTYKAMKDERQQFTTRLKSLKDSSTALANPNKNNSGLVDKSQMKALEQNHIKTLQQLERNIQNVIKQIAFEKKYPQISFKLADKLAGADDITKEILEKLQ